MGRGSPTVVFDGGWEDWSPAWALVQPQVAAMTRACSYDRAGSGFSDAGPMPRTSLAIASELHEALHTAGVSAPYVLVGHSFGSYNTRVFAQRYMPEVGGLVLVDGESGDVEAPKARQDDAREYASAINELRSCRGAVRSQSRLPLLRPRPGKPRMSCDQQFFRGLHERIFSPSLNAVVLRIAATRVALYDAVISEMEQMPADELYLQQHRPAFGARPVRILTAQHHYADPPSAPTAVVRRHRADERTEAATQARWLTLSSDAKQIFALKSGHYIEFDQPDLVVKTILKVVDIARNPNRCIPIRRR